MGAGLEQEDKIEFMTPLQWACSRGDTTTVEVLLTAGADPSIMSSKSGKTALEVVPNAKKEIFRLIYWHSKQTSCRLTNSDGKRIPQSCET